MDYRYSKVKSALEHFHAFEEHDSDYNIVRRGYNNPYPYTVKIKYSIDNGETLFSEPITLKGVKSFDAIKLYEAIKTIEQGFVTNTVNPETGRFCKVHIDSVLSCDEKCGNKTIVTFDESFEDELFGLVTRLVEEGICKAVSKACSHWIALEDEELIVTVIAGIGGTSDMFRVSCKELRDSIMRELGFAMKDGVVDMLCDYDGLRECVVDTIALWKGYKVEIEEPIFDKDYITLVANEVVSVLADSIAEAFIREVVAISDLCWEIMEQNGGTHFKYTPD